MVGAAAVQCIAVAAVMAIAASGSVMRMGDSPLLRVYSNGTHAYPFTDAPSGVPGIQVRTIALGQPNGTAGAAVMQTHEVAFCSKRERAYVSLLTTGQMFEFRFDGQGRLSAAPDRWTFNSRGSGVHNIAASVCSPGLLWISTQVRGRAQALT